MEVYIIRHGQTIWNASAKLQGHTDIELDERGRASAIELGERLEEDGVVFDAIYSSPLSRAYETACFIRGRQNIPVIKDDRLKEIGFGEMEGVTYDVWLKSDSPYRFFFDEPGQYFPPPGGESLEELCERAKDFVRSELETDFKAKRILVAGHGALNKAMMCYLEGYDKSNFWGSGLQKNCEADVFSYDGNTWSKVGKYGMN